MLQKNNTTLLKISLVTFTIVSLVYGLCYVFIPQVLVDLSGSEGIQSSWLRWSGGILVSLGIGAILVYRNPSKQDPFVTTIALGTLFTGLALLYALLFEMSGKFWFTAVPMIITLVLSALLWVSKDQAKKIIDKNNGEANQ